MALAYVSGQAKYIDKARNLIAQCDSLPEKVWGMTWEELLDRYDWRGESWRGTEKPRQTHSQVLRTAAESGRLRDAVNSITDWGQVQRFDEAEVQEIAGGIQSLPLLNAGRIDPAGFYSARVASTSKVYASVDLKSWVIFDSRVARALALIINHVGTLDPRFFRLPQPPDRGHKRRVEGFPVLSSASSKQATLAFLYSSWLCRAVADSLNAVGTSTPMGGWTVHRVEMALFTAGAR